MFVRMVAEVLLPILTDWGLPVKDQELVAECGLQSKCRQFVGEFVGDDCIKSRALSQMSLLVGGGLIDQCVCTSSLCCCWRS